jgi:hypothetical protein
LRFQPFACEDRSIDTSIIEVAVETLGETLQAKPGDLF